MRLAKALTTSALLLAAGAVPAQEVIGTIEGTIDGEPRTWYLTTWQGQSQSDVTDLGGIVSVTAFGHATDNSIMSTEGALLLSWTRMSGQTINPEVRFMPTTSFMEGFVQSDDAPPEIIVEAQEARGDALYVKGTMIATLGWTDSPAQDADMGRTVAVDVRFEGTIPPLD